MASKEVLGAGEYGKDEETGIWYCRPPGTAIGCEANLSQHTITEHEDGTITVSPSILISGGCDWHGFLERGEWRPT